MVERRLKRAGGRATRVAARKAPQSEFDPSAPGQVGGRYKPLNQRELTETLDTAYKILAEIGMAEVPQVIEDLALSKGAHLNDRGRLCFPKAMMEDIIDGAAKGFVYYGRDPKHDFEVGGDKVYFGTGGAAVQTLDLQEGIYRPSTLKDLYDFTRLIDTLENVSWFTR